jgi:hypothetical protein
MNAIFSKSMILAVLFLASGCATIFNGRHQDIAFASTPAGATVEADGERLCETPCTASLKRSSDHVVTMNVPGHYPYRMILRSKGSNWVALDALFVVYPLIDLIVGSAWYLTPEQVDRTLDKQEAKAVGEREGGPIGVQAALAP